MAKITLSDKAPEGAKLFSLASDEIEVPFETNDPEILSNAGVHPWLKVERDVETDEFVQQGAPVFPADDPANSLANDPEAVAAERERREIAFGEPTAIDAGLDQGDVEFVGDEDHEVAVTLAAADSRDSDDDEEVPADPLAGPVEAHDEPAEDAVSDGDFTPFTDTPSTSEDNS